MKRRFATLVACLAAITIGAGVAPAATIRNAPETTSISVQYGQEAATVSWTVSSTTNVVFELVEAKYGEGAWAKSFLPAATRSETVTAPAGPASYRVWQVLKTGNKEASGTIKAAPKEEPPKEEPPKGSEQTTWTPAGSFPLTDAQAAARVIHHEEKKPQNASFARYVPTQSEVEAFHTAAASFSPNSALVDGRSGLTNPSTDDLIQWAAAKWGIPANVLRADDMQESGWDHLLCAGGVACNSEGGPAGAGLEGHGFGDCGNPSTGVGPPAAVHTAACPTNTEMSIGITQVKEQSCCHVGTFPLAWKSLAFNEDYQASIIRYYFDGHCGWCSFNYKGDEWDSIGAWNAPGSGGPTWYIEGVKKHLAAQDWPK